VKNAKKSLFLVKWKYHPPSAKGAISLYIQYNMDQLCLLMDLEEELSAEAEVHQSGRESRIESQLALPPLQEASQGEAKE
jgi:hypothetical protein